jgi:hypothetical protein
VVLFLQLLPRAQVAACHTRDGSRDRGSRLDHSGINGNGLARFCGSSSHCLRCILSGMEDSAKPRFLRLFVVVTTCWILFCLFVQPVLMARKGASHYEKDVRSCYEDSARYQSNVQDCLSDAKRELQTGSYAGFGVEYDKGRNWSYGWYFRVMWQLLLIEIIVPPSLLYGLVWITVIIFAWIWRGSKTVTRP